MGNLKFDSSTRVLKRVEALAQERLVADTRDTAAFWSGQSIRQIAWYRG